MTPGDAILDERMAQKIFGDVNPIGATLTISIHSDSIRLTVVDVYKELGRYDFFSHGIRYAISEEEMIETFNEMHSEEFRFKKHCYTGDFMEFVLKEGYTPAQLEEEVDRRVAFLGLKARAMWLKDTTFHAYYMKTIREQRALVYLMGSLILLAACIGFLRMQIQLFWMRKREMVLRIVNGAKRHHLFVLLMTEVGLVVAGAVAVALLVALWLEPFINILNFNLYQGLSRIIVEHLLPYCVVIGLGLLVVFGMVVWMVLSHICNSSFNLAAGMRGNRSHTFRNAMLCLQICVGMLFMGAALLVAFVCEKKLQQYVLPEDEAPYRESILVNYTQAHYTVRDRMKAELMELPDVAQVVPFNYFNMQYEDLSRVDSLVKQQWKCWQGTPYFYTIMANDTTVLDFFRLPVKWMRPEAKEGPFILIQEDLFAILEKEGVLANGVMTHPLRYSPQLHVAGTFKEVPFSERAGEKQVKFIIIQPDNKELYSYVLVPRPDRYDALWSDIQQTVARVEPTNVTRYYFNFYEHEAPMITLQRSIRTGGWILGAVAMLLCVMGIYSTISLDTRARRKEVAIRKINGAKTGDIASLFARVYVLLVALALLITLPLALILLHYYAQANGMQNVFPDTPTVMLLFLGGSLIVSLSIALIVGWHVRHIMRVNPAEMIAKE